VLDGVADAEWLGSASRSVHSRETRAHPAACSWRGTGSRQRVQSTQRSTHEFLARVAPSSETGRRSTRGRRSRQQGPTGS
jgi:hypothetical protein